MQNKIDRGLSCLQEKKWLDIACCIDSIMHDLSHNHFFFPPGPQYVLQGSGIIRDWLSVMQELLKGKKVIF